MEIIKFNVNEIPEPDSGFAKKILQDYIALHKGQESSDLYYVRNQASPFKAFKFETKPLKGQYEIIHSQGYNSGSPDRNSFYVNLVFGGFVKGEPDKVFIVHLSKHYATGEIPRDEFDATQERLEGIFHDWFSKLQVKTDS